MDVTIIQIAVALVALFIAMEIAQMISQYREDIEDPIMREIRETMAYEPNSRETILFRALSRFYGEYGDMESGWDDPRGRNQRKDAVIDEAYHALAVASHDWRNALTEHTWVAEDERAEDNPHRIDWEWPSGEDY